MKKNLLAIFLKALLINLSCYQQNKKTIKHTLSSGENIEVLVYEELNLVDQVWVLKSYSEIPSLKGKDWRDEEFYIATNDIWNKIKPFKNESKIKTGSVAILRRKNHMCSYLFSREKNGMWKNVN